MGLLRGRWVRATNTTRRTWERLLSIVLFATGTPGKHQRKSRLNDARIQEAARNEALKGQRATPHDDSEILPLRQRLHVRLQEAANTAIERKHELHHVVHGGITKVTSYRSAHFVRAFGALGACALLFGLAMGHSNAASFDSSSDARLAAANETTSSTTTISTTTTPTTTSSIATDASTSPSTTTTTTMPPEKLKLLQDLGKHAPNGEKLVALTFDDGPGKATPDVLRILREKNVKATFCMVGRNVQNNPEYAREIVAAGMGVCNHTHSHDLHLSSKPRSEIEKEIRGGSDDIFAVTGVRTTVLRLPGGAMSPDIVDAAHANGEYIAHWSVDPRDWATPGTQSIVTTVMRDTAPGAIVLLHDGDGGSKNGGRKQTVDALPVLIDQLRAQGYTFVDLAAVTPEYRKG